MPSPLFQSAGKPGGGGRGDGGRCCETPIQGVCGQMEGGNRPCLQLLPPLKGGPPALIPSAPKSRSSPTHSWLPCLTLHPRTGRKPQPDSVTSLHPRACNGSLVPLRLEGNHSASKLPASHYCILHPVLPEAQQPSAASPTPHTLTHYS